MSTSNPNETQVSLEEAMLLAQQHHQAGNLMVADRTYRDVLNAVPDYFPALHYLSIVCYQRGHLEEALELCEKAVKANPEDALTQANYAIMLAESDRCEEAVPIFEKALTMAGGDTAQNRSNFSHTLWLLDRFEESEAQARKAVEMDAAFPDGLLNLGNALEAQGDREGAIEYWKKVLEVAPAYFKALNNLGYALNMVGKSIEAEDYCRRALALNPEYPEAWNNLGNALYAQGKIEDAEQAYRQTTNFKPDFYQAQNNLAVVLLAQGRFPEAAAAARYAISFARDYADAYSTLSLAQRAQGDMNSAEESINQALKLLPDKPELLLDYADLLLLMDRLDDAKETVDKAMALDPDTPQAYAKLADVTELMGDVDKALEYVEKGIALNPDYLEFYVRKAQINHINNDLPQAIEAIDKALEMAPRNIQVMAVKADILQSLGKMDEALALTREALDINPDVPNLYAGLAKIKKFTTDDVDFKRMKELAKKGEQLGYFQLSGLNYALFSAYEQVGQYKKAFDCLLAASAAKRKSLPYNSAVSEAQYAHIKETHPKGFEKKFAGKGCDSDIPVLIVGMPRSGTTLTEQIISAHPAVFGAGELPYLSQTLRQNPDMSPAQAKEIGEEYMRLLKTRDESGKALRITDKMPGNFTRIGDVICALPHAKIIHCRRNPIDTCLSCLKQNFARGQYWSYSLEELAAEYRRYADLMQYWRETLPEGSFIEINYEDTVNDLETQARRLIDYVGLDWDDACLAPHKNKRAVLTASKSQVIKPVYKSSVKGWKRYEKQLQPLIEGLGDLLPENSKKKPAAAKNK